MVQLITKVMKNTLYVIAGLLIAIWFIAFLGYNAKGMIHALLAAAILIFLNLIVFNRQLSNE